MKIEILSSFKKDFKNLTSKNLTRMQECVLGDVLHLSKNKINQLRNSFPNQTLDNKKDVKYENIKNKIINYLERNKVNKKEILKNNEKVIIYSFIFNDNFYSCQLNINNNEILICSQIDSLNYSKLISESGRFKLTDNFKSFPINLGTFNNEMPIIWLDNENDEFKINKKGTYYFIKQDIKNKNLKFDFLNSEAKLFIQGNFENVNFEFNREFNFQKDKISEIRYDKNLLTGCVNFFDTNFKNIILKSSDMICEDSINIKNSSGIINKIQIDNSYFDALDLDFSKIKINDLKVNNAKNDCIDFSFGEYEIIYANLKNCGDKGLSVGERSKLNMHNGVIMYSNIGIASKDDAITNVKNVAMNNMNICLAAYNKKNSTIITFLNHK